MRPSQTQDKFIVRLPDGMREQISEAAAANNRSMTAEIVARLSKSFEEKGSVTASPSILDEIEILREQIRHESSERQTLDSKLYHMEMRLYKLEVSR